GHCLGGSIAEYVALKQGVPGVGINTLPIGPGLQKAIGNEKLQRADDIFRHVIVDTDIFSDPPPMLKVVDAVMNFFGVRTIANFGTETKLPTIFDERSTDTHNYAIAS